MRSSGWPDHQPPMRGAFEYGSGGSSAGQQPFGPGSTATSSVSSSSSFQPGQPSHFTLHQLLQQHSDSSGGPGSGAGGANAGSASSPPRPGASTGPMGRARSSSNSSSLSSLLGSAAASSFASGNGSSSALGGRFGGTSLPSLSSRRVPGSSVQGSLSGVAGDSGDLMNQFHSLGNGPIVGSSGSVSSSSAQPNSAAAAAAAAAAVAAAAQQQQLRQQQQHFYTQHPHLSSLQQQQSGQHQPSQSQQSSAHLRHSQHLQSGSLGSRGLPSGTTGSGHLQTRSTSMSGLSDLSSLANSLGGTGGGSSSGSRLRSSTATGLSNSGLVEGGGGGGGVSGQSGSGIRPRRAGLPLQSTLDPDNREPQRWFALDLSGQQLTRLTRSIASYRFLTALFLNDNQLSTLPEAALAELVSLRHLDLSNNRFAVLPRALGLLVTLEILDLYENNFVEFPLEMGRLFRLKQLGLDRDNCVVTPPQTVVQQGTEQIVAWLRDRMPPSDPPPARQWVASANAADDSATVDKFSIFCYNILAESYAVQDRHFYCPGWVLDWNYRKERILKEILSRDTDVVCLQEVEARQFQTFFEPEMEHVGYSGVFKPKSRARTMGDWGSVDGCVVFFKQDKFELVDDVIIEFQTMAMAKHREFEGDSECLQRLLRRDNVAVVAVLARVGAPPGQPPVLVVNTHVHWDPKMCDVKLMQVAFLVEKLDELVGPGGQYAGSPLVLCGDFNLEPKSGAFQLLSTGAVGPNHADFTPEPAAPDESPRTYSYGRYTKTGVKHNLDLVSSYAPLGHPFTNYTGDFVGCLDYVFVNPVLHPVRVLEPVPEAAVRLTCLPNAYMCSDHVPLAVELQILKNPGSTRRAAELGDGDGTGIGSGEDDDDDDDDDGDDAGQRSRRSGPNRSARI